MNAIAPRSSRSRDADVRIPAPSDFLAPPSDDDILYPESDGKPMADNTLQWDWMVMIVGELRDLFAGQEIFVAGDLLWYPLKGQPRISAAPDAMVVFGRPAGHRRSYLQWKEGGLGPQVVFEVLSHSNTDDELDAKLEFYTRHGVEEYYVIDPDEMEVEGYVRRGERLGRIRKILGFTSPRLGTRFEKPHGELLLLMPSGRPFQSRTDRIEELMLEIRQNAALAQDERNRADTEQNRADTEQNRADTEQNRADTEQNRADVEAAAKLRLAAKLRELGVDPDAV